MDKSRLNYLFSKYINNTISRAELADLLNHIREEGEIGELDAIIEKLKKQESILKKSHSFDHAMVFEEIKNRIHHDQYKSSFKQQKLKRRLSAVAVILLIIGISAVWVRNSRPTDIEVEVVEKNEIHLPDHNLAAVLFEDGRILTLSDMDEEILNNEGIHRVQTSEGRVAYRIIPNENHNHTQHTFNSPRGTSSTLVLSDGSTVWLNSGSKITYPTSFRKGERRVLLEGEAYFDIQHENNEPFIVSANGTEVKVLGTEFNIATNIEPEKIFTTLISGIVQVYSNGENLTISPGTQSITSPSSSQIETKPVDLREVIAWKEGYFRFKDDDILTVLTKIKGWYDIKGIDIQKTTTDRFTGAVLRTRKLSDLLGQLEKISNYKFKIMEGRVIVMKP